MRPKNSQKKDAEAAKALLTVPDGDHLTLLNVYNSYQQSTYMKHIAIVECKVDYISHA